MESLFKLFKTISPSGYQYKDKKSYHPFWEQEGGSDVSSYNDLTDLPKIGGIEVKGNKSLATYHLYSKEEVDALIEAIPTGTGLVKTVKEIDAAMFAAATNNVQLQMLNTDKFVHSFTIGSKEYTAGSNLQVMSNISGDLAFTYYDSVANKGYLVILSSAAVEGEITAIHCKMYKGWIYQSNLASDATITLDNSYTFHKIKCSLNFSFLYPDGTEVAGDNPLEVTYTLISDNSDDTIQYVLHSVTGEGLANMRISAFSYGLENVFSISSFTYDNKDDLTTQDRVFKVNSGSITVVKEW